jgi:response regulator NasT
MMKRVRILLADDDRVILTTMTEDLEQAGYAVIKASNGLQAVELCDKESPDLAILDVSMPQMDGIQAAEIIREKHDIPVMFLSAYGDRDIVDQAINKGAAGYMVKPISVERMIPGIETALARTAVFNEARNKAMHLSRALETGREIDVCVGLIMARYGLNRNEAFAVLRRMARSENIKVNELAARMVAAAENLAIPHRMISDELDKS